MHSDHESSPDTLESIQEKIQQLIENLFDDPVVLKARQASIEAWIQNPETSLSDLTSLRNYLKDYPDQSKAAITVLLEITEMKALEKHIADPNTDLLSVRKYLEKSPQDEKIKHYLTCLNEQTLERLIDADTGRVKTKQDTEALFAKLLQHTSSMDLFLVKQRLEKQPQNEQIPYLIELVEKQAFADFFKITNEAGKEKISECYATRQEAKQAMEALCDTLLKSASFKALDSSQQKRIEKYLKDEQNPAGSLSRMFQAKVSRGVSSQAEAPQNESKMHEQPHSDNPEAEANKIASSIYEQSPKGEHLSSVTKLWHEFCQGFKHIFGMTTAEKARESILQWGSTFKADTQQPKEEQPAANQRNTKKTR